MNKIDINDFYGVRALDVFGLMHNYKKIISTSITDGLLKKLKETFIKYKLKFITLDKSFDFRNQNKTYLISKRIDYLKEAKRAYKSGRFDIVGDYLGYPKCCIDFYCKCQKDSGDYFFADFIFKIYKNSHIFLWQLNNILNFEGRAGAGEFIHDFPREIKKIGFISLISHNPCSYDCEPSLKIAMLNYKYYLFHRMPSFYNLAILAKPVLFIDNFNFIFFEGISGRGYIRYSKTLFCLGVTNLIRLIVKGNQLKIKNREVIVFNYRRIIGKIRYHKPILILPFNKTT